ncbi:pyridoxamine 5'-phosphate oxidase family protein [Haladaptatus sp. NG-SE-30]
MNDHRAVQMDADGITDFLGRGGSGVLSLAKDDAPYSIPVSYGYDASSRRFFIRLGFTGESEKRAYLNASEMARLVVYGQTESGWKSVIATGQLEEATDSDIDVHVVWVLRESQLPVRDLFEVPPDEVSFDMYRLDVEELSGRQTANGTSGSV